jgi:hypothetical protein
MEGFWFAGESAIAASVRHNWKLWLLEVFTATSRTRSRLAGGVVLRSQSGFGGRLPLLSEGKVRRVVGGCVCYSHMLFDQHEIVETDGALSESLYIGAQSLQTLPSASVAELFELFPDLKARVGREPMARQVARRHEAAFLISA